MGTGLRRNSKREGIGGGPKGPGMIKQEIAGGGAVEFQLRGDVVSVLQVKHHQRRIILPYGVGQKGVHTHTQDYDLGTRSIAKQTPQCIEPVVVAGGLEKNGVDAELAGS